MKDVKMINIQIETSQLMQAKKMAHRREMSLSEYIRELIFADLRESETDQERTDRIISETIEVPCPHPPEAQQVVTHQRPNDGPDEGTTSLECTSCGATLS